MGKLIKIFMVFMILFSFILTGCVEETFGGEGSGEVNEDNARDNDIDTGTEEIENQVNRESVVAIATGEMLELIPWEDYSISINIPVGWNIYTGGECPTRSFLVRDPNSELKQLFYFSEAGPVYTGEEMKENDKSYMEMGGSDVIWYESPVVNPLTAENFLINFGALAQTPFFQKAFPEVPILGGVEIISSESIENNMPYVVDEKLIRAEFVQNVSACEGYFHIVTANVIDLGYGAMFIGVTAPRGLLDLIVPSLTESIKSFEVKNYYVDSCIEAQNKAVAGILEAGRILESSSDTIIEVWENKLRSEERMSEQMNDTILGRSRLYNPETDEVYGITPEFYGYYTVHSSEFEMNYLEEVPDDKWGYAPLNGAEHIY